MSDTERIGELLQGCVSRAKLAQLREAERERDDLLRVRKEWESEYGRLSRQLAGAVGDLEKAGRLLANAQPLAPPEDLEERREWWNETKALLDHLGGR